MNHLEASTTGRNNVFIYILMLAVLFVVMNTIGSIPLYIAFIKAASVNHEVSRLLAANPKDFSVLGMNPYMELSSLLFPFVAAFVAFAFLVKPLNDRSLKITINGGKKIRWSHFLISAATWAVISAIYLFVYLKIEPGNFVLNNKTISLLYISVIALILIPFQAGLEEVVFRGYLMQGFSVVVRNRFFPLIMTSVSFGLLHSFNPEVDEYGFLTMMPQYVLFGLIFGILTLLDDGIEAAMGAHAANNIFLVIFVTNQASALRSPALYTQVKVQPWTEFTGLLVSGVMFLIILKIVFRWNDVGKIFRRIQGNQVLS